MRSTRVCNILIVLCALAATVSATGTGCKKGNKTTTADSKADPVVAVKLEAAVDAPTPDVLTVTGTVVPNRTSNVAADGSGRAIEVLVDRGSRVKAGDPLLRLDTRNAVISAREANADLSSARSQRALADEECRRTKQLFDKGAINKSEFDRQQTSCNTALDQVSAAEARAQMVTKQMSDGVVRAPFAGVITDRWITAGEWVTPATRLFTLIDDNPLKANLTVPESVSTQVAVDQIVDLVSIALPGKSYRAKVTRVGSDIGTTTRALLAEATIDAGSPLKSGMFVEAHITLGQNKYPSVPATAVIKRGQTWRLYVANAGHLQERVVQVGPVPAPGKVSIMSGVKAGEQVVVTANEQTVDGAKIQ